MADDQLHNMDSRDEEDTQYLDLSDLDFEIEADDIPLEPEIGKGDDSYVYRALYQNRLEVAVKFCQGSSLIVAEKERFLRQIDILKGTNHKNIVKFIGSAIDNNSLMLIVLELLMDCPNVEECIRLSREDGEVMNVTQALNIGYFTAAAMEYLHSKGIMHRNLKPSNVLIAKDGTPKLTGFSNAVKEIADAEEDVAPVNRPPLAMRSIEKKQWKPDNRRMDIYSFGQMFYKVLKSVAGIRNKNMNASGPLYLASSKEGYPSMENIPEAVVDISRFCLEGSANFKLINERICSVMACIECFQAITGMSVEEMVQASTSIDVIELATASHKIDRSDLCYGPVISITPSGTFYLAKYQSRHVVVKIFEDAEIEDVKRERRNKFHRQVEVLSRNEHRNIVQFIGSCTEPSLTIMTEYMKGGTLERYLFELVQKPLCLKIAISFALGISKAMRYLHAKDITHGDLKTSNVFLTSDQDFVKLGGFGHAREITDETPMISEASTSSSRPITKQNDRQADVYNFSTILWELMSYDGNTFHNYFATPLANRPIFENVPDEMVRLMEACASEYAEARPDFEQITCVLRKLQDENPLSEDEDEDEDEDESVGMPTLFGTPLLDFFTIDLGPPAPTPVTEPELEPEPDEENAGPKSYL